MAKYLDQSGVAYLWRKIKNQFATTATTEQITGSVQTLKTTFETYTGATNTRLDVIESGYVHTITSSDSSATITRTDGNTVDIKVPSASVQGIADGEKILSLDNAKLSTDLSINYVKADKKLQLLGKVSGESRALVSEIDVTDFVKDGMLDYAGLHTRTTVQGIVTWNPALPESIVSSGVTEDGTYIVLKWNTDGKSDAMFIDVTSLIDIYTAGNGIDISDNVVSVKLNETHQSNIYLVNDANGLKVEGLSAVTNDKQVKAIANSISGNVVTWGGTDGATVADGGLKVSDLATTAVTDTLSGRIDTVTGNVSDLSAATQAIEGDYVKKVSTVTENHIVTWGADGRTIKDSNFTIATSVPANALFTDSAVTGVASHYKQDSVAEADKVTKNAVNGTVVDITSGSVNVVTGIKLDKAGHVDSLVSTEVKVDATKDEYMPYADIDAAINYAETHNLPYTRPINFN